MILRCAAVFIPLFLIGCAAQSDPPPAPLANDSSTTFDDVAELTETPLTKSTDPQTPETETVDVQTVSTEKIVMTVPGMH